MKPACAFAPARPASRDRSAHTTEILRRKARTLAGPSRALLSAIGHAVWARNHAMARVQLGDKPETLWTHPELRRLNARLVEEFELAERAAALGRKLALIDETVRTMLSLVEGRRSLPLEIAVATFIAAEPGSGLHQLFSG